MTKVLKVGIILALFIIAVPVSAITSPYHPADTNRNFQIDFVEWNSFRDNAEISQPDKDKLAQLFLRLFFAGPNHYYYLNGQVWDISTTQPTESSASKTPIVAVLHPADTDKNYQISYTEAQNYLDLATVSQQEKVTLLWLFIENLNTSNQYYRRVAQGWQSSATSPAVVAGGAAYDLKTPVVTGSITKGTSTPPAGAPYGSIRWSRAWVNSSYGIESNVIVHYDVDITTGSKPLIVSDSANISFRNITNPSLQVPSARAVISAPGFPAVNNQITLKAGTTTITTVRVIVDANKFFSGQYSFALECIPLVQTEFKCLPLTGERTTKESPVIVGEKQAQLHSIGPSSSFSYGSTITLTGANFNRGENNVRFGYHRRQNNSTTFTPLVTKTGVSSDGKQLKVTLPTSAELESREVVLVQVQNPRTPQGSLFNYGWSNLIPVNLPFTPTSTAPSITVLSPNGGETWVRGTTQKVSWRFSGTSGSDSTIWLESAGTGGRNYQIANVKAGTNSHEWVVGTPDVWGYAVPDGEYKLRVCSSVGSDGNRIGICDYSDSTLKIVGATSSAPSVSVLSPNGGETWVRGSVQTVRWQFNNIATSNEVTASSNLNLVSLAGTEYPLVGGWGGQTYEWKNVGTDAWGSTRPIPDGSYKLRICSVINYDTNRTNACDESNSYFKIITDTPTPSLLKALGVSSLVDDSYAGRNADSRYWAKNLIDGDASTYAYTSNYRMGYVIALDGGYYVSQVKLNWGRYGGTGYVQGYSLYGRTPAGRWLLLTSRNAGTSGVGGNTDDTFEEQLITHLAIVSGGSIDTEGKWVQGNSQSNNWVGIYEAEVYGHPGAKGSLNSQVANVFEALRMFLLNIAR